MNTAALRSFQNRYEEPAVDPREIEELAIESICDDIRTDWVAVNEALMAHVFDSPFLDVLAEAFVKEQATPHRYMVLGMAIEDVIYAATRRMAEAEYTKREG